MNDSTLGYIFGMYTHKSTKKYYIPLNLHEIVMRGHYRSITKI